MKDRLYIDGVNAYEAYGIFPSEGGYRTLVQYPAMKEVKCVDWPEENGVEPDLLNPVLSAKENFSISLSCNQYPSGLDALNKLLTDGAYHEFYFKEIGVTAVLRLNGISGLKAVGNLAKMNMNVSFDADFLSQFIRTLSNLIKRRWLNIPANLYYILSYYLTFCHSLTSLD